MAKKKTIQKLPKGRLVDKIATAKHRAKIAQEQVNSNMERGSKVNIYDNYAAASTAAQRTKDLNRLNSSSKTAGRAKNMESKLNKAAAKKATSYSPKPMTAAAKAKAAAAGKATGAKTKPRGPKAGSSTVSKAAKTAAKVAGKIAGRAGTTAREARDVVTAVGTSARSRLNTRVYRSASGGLKSTPTSKANTAAADKNLKKQLKETVKAATTGKKGTTSAQTGGKPSKKRK